MSTIAQEDHARVVRRLEVEMMEWVEGRKSTINAFLMICPDDPAKAQAMCAVADAAEVQKLSSAIQAFNSRRTF